MYFPKGRHLDSITYVRIRSPDSGRNIVVWHLSGNVSGNVLRGSIRVTMPANRRIAVLPSSVYQALLHTMLVLAGKLCLCVVFSNATPS